jgi:hypothetical protein
MIELILIIPIFVGLWTINNIVKKQEDFVTLLKRISRRMSILEQDMAEHRYDRIQSEIKKNDE